RLEELIGHATDGVERVRVIANDLKTFSRGDEGSWLPVDLNRVVESATNLAHNEIRHRAELTIERGDVAPVMGSETRFVQVLVNLLVNAAQAIPEGHAADNRIAVRTGTASQTVWVEVEDTGHGIAPELVDHIFEPFWTNKPDVGIGLGLSICHGIVSAAGGVIRVVESRPGRTVFRIELPAAPHDAPPREVRTPPPPSAPASQARILIVDDELKLARTLAIALGERFHVDIATNGREALAKRGDGGTYDLVLCDLMMPELSGMDLYETLIAERPSLARRIVFMTGGAFTDRAREVLKRGGIRRLEKPFSIEAIEALLLEPR
ncbi:MAG: response regulator, partial [Sandaracinaceae bacterium]|nr:response regulator [Sandaracinaceae bacterium]